MEEAEKQAILQTIEAWRIAAPLLEAERRSRLRAMTDEDTRNAALDVLSLPIPDLPERGSGLVEQQRLFDRLR